MKDCGNKALLLFCAFFVVLLYSCRKNDESDTKVSIVVTNFVIFDATRAVLGDAFGGSANVTLLLKPGMEVHSYDPTIADMVAIQASDLFIYIGGESDEWVQRILAASNDDLNVLRLWDFVDTTREVDVSSNKSEVAEFDEHVWLSPSNEVKIINAVYDAINGLIPLKRSLADSYISQIKELEAKIQHVVNVSFIDKSRSLVVADRFPFAYFVNYYKIPYVAAFNGCSSMVEPNIETVSRITDLVKLQNIPIVYYIELSNRAICNVICNECKVDARLLHSMQNVMQQEFDDNETYVSIMTRNMHALEQ